MIRPEDRPERPYTARRLAQISRRLEKLWHVDRRVLVATLAKQAQQATRQPVSA